MAGIMQQMDLEEPEKGNDCLKIRYVQVSLLFFMLVISLNFRLCLPVAIIAMTSNSTSSNPDVPYYEWTNSDIILSSFYWSYAILQFVAGNFVHRFGAKNLLLVAIFINSISSVLIPAAAKYAGADGVMALRVIQGLFQGFMLPCLNGILGKWLPPSELSSWNSIVYSGFQVGAVVSTIVTGYLSASSWGWPSAFYFFAVLGLIWCFFWWWLSAESPAVHSSISTSERNYIEKSLGQEDDHLIDKKSIPWRAIAQSLPYWAIIVAAVGESWATTFLNSELPRYLSYAVGLDITDSSLFTAIPIVGSLVGSLVYSPIAGYTISKGWLTVVGTRRIFQGFSMFSISMGLIVLSYLESKIPVAAVLIALNTASSAVASGHIVNHLDLSPRYAAILSGISNGIGQLIAIFAPVLVHFIVTVENDKTLWRSTFILTAVIGSVTTLFFMVFCTADRQWWDDIDRIKREEKSNRHLDGQDNAEYKADSYF